MALQISIQLNNGLEVPNSYIKVGSLNGDKESLRIVLFRYASQQAALEGKEFIDIKEYTFKPAEEDNSLRWDRQAYEYLKTLAEYDGAVDC